MPSAIGDNLTRAIEIGVADWGSKHAIWRCRGVGTRAEILGASFGPRPPDPGTTRANLFAHRYILISPQQKLPAESKVTEQLNVPIKGNFGAAGLAAGQLFFGKRHIRTVRGSRRGVVGAPLQPVFGLGIDGLGFPRAECSAASAGHRGHGQ